MLRRMNDRKHVHLFGLQVYDVNEAVVPIDEFTDVFIANFRDDSSHPWKRLQLLCLFQEFLDEERRVVGSDIFVVLLNGFEVVQGLRPPRERRHCILRLPPGTLLRGLLKLLFHVVVRYALAFLIKARSHLLQENEAFDHVLQGNLFVREVFEGTKNFGL